MLRFIGIMGCTFVAATAAQAQTPGKTIFEGKGNCWTCHGRNAQGTPLGPDLTDNVWLHGDGSADSIRAIVLRGVPQPQKHPAPMPPMGGAKLSKVEIDAVVAYVHSLRAPAPPPPERRR